MTVRTITTWTSFPDETKQQEILDNALASQAAETLLEYTSLPNSGGFKNNMPPMTSIRVWSTLEAAEAWIAWLATIVPDGYTTETI